MAVSETNPFSDISKSTLAGNY